MSSDAITLSLPALPTYARSVRMLASTLAVANNFAVDDVEDVRMAAEEGFVYACSTGIDMCTMSFSLSTGEVSMDFNLGEGEDALQADFGEDLDLVELLLDAVCDEFEVNDSADVSVLHLVKRVSYDRA